MRALRRQATSLPKLTDLSKPLQGDASELHPSLVRLQSDVYAAAECPERDRLPGWNAALA